MSITRAMILAAGHGSRMAPLTDRCPKPLLLAGKYRLIEYTLYAIARAGIRECVINQHHFPELFVDYLGRGERYGLHIEYSYESELLGTAGGIIQALDFFENQPFLLLSADIITDYPFEKLIHMPLRGDAHLVMVDNPEQNSRGDFYLAQGELCLEGNQRLSYASIGLCHPRLFSGYEKGERSIGEVLKPAIARRAVSGEHFQGLRISVDTPERLGFVRHMHQLIE